MNDIIVSRVDKARLLLSQASNATDAKKVADLAKAAKVYAERQKLGEEAISYARAVIVDAITLMGEFLSVMRKASGGEHGGKSRLDGSRREPSNKTSTIASVGVSKKESSNAQLLAALAKKKPSLHAAVRSGQITISKALTEAKKEERKETLKKTEWPANKHRVIYADPPWQYGDARTGTAESGGVVAQYETMPLEAICAMKVAEVSLPDSVLFLWATSPLIPEAIRVIEAWGFKYKASFIWDKVRGFNGHYNDVQHELLLVATRGSCVPESETLNKSIVRCEKDRHSKKPEVFRQMIDAMYPSGPRLELFARSAASGWAVWGNEAQ